MENRAEIHTKLDSQNNTTTHHNYDLFADDSPIEVSDITHTKPLLGTYNESPNEYSLS